MSDQEFISAVDSYKYLISQENYEKVTTNVTGISDEDRSAIVNNLKVVADRFKKMFAERKTKEEILDSNEKLFKQIEDTFQSRFQAEVATHEKAEAATTEKEADALLNQL